jgi:HK97 family phage major capsid protein
MIEDSAFDVAGWLLRDAGRSLASEEDIAFYNGIRTTPPETFEGTATTATTVTNGFYVPTLSQSVDEELPTLIDYMHLVVMFYALPESERAGAIWTGGSLVGQYLSQIVDTNEFRPVLRDTGTGNLTIMGHPFVEFPAAEETGTTPASFANRLYFVNMERAYIVLDGEIKMARTTVGGAAFAEDMTHFRITHRTIGMRVVVNPNSSSNRPAVNPYVYTGAIFGPGVPTAPV